MKQFLPKPQAKPRSKAPHTIAMGLLLGALPVAVCAQQVASLPEGPSHSDPAPLRTASSQSFDGLFSHYVFNYEQPLIGATTFQDSAGDPQRAALLVTDGEIHLSLRDAIALAIENNLDVESVRLLSPMARVDLARAQSGRLLFNVPSATNNGQSSAAGNLATASPFGFEGGGTPAGVSPSNVAVQLAGTPIPDTEPAFFSSGRVNHSVLPQANTTVTGTDFLNTKQEELQFGYRKGYFTGTNVTASFDAMRTSRNAPFDSIDPAITGSAVLNINQPLLQGFGRRTNMRAIYIARNNAKVADLTFRQQLILTVSQVQGLYYDLVSFLQQTQVITSAIDRDKKQLTETERSMDLGMSSKADVIQAQLRIDNDRQALTDAQAQIEAQEATLKTALTHAGLENPAIAKAQIVPTDVFQAPQADPAKENPDANADRAIAQRTEIRQGELNLASKQLDLQGTRNALLPVLNLYLTLQNNALAGELNRFATTSIVNATDTRFVGGLGSVFDQLAHRNYPDYEVGFQLNIPITNRAAQSNMIRDQIDLRQQQISQQSLRNGVRLQAIKASLALKQAREQYELSVNARKLMEQNLDTEQKMLELGNSEPTRVLAIQESLDRSRIREITSLNTYARAQVNLQAVLNETLEDNDIVIDSPQAKIR